MRRQISLLAGFAMFAAIPTSIWAQTASEPVPPADVSPVAPAPGQTSPVEPPVVAPTPAPVPTPVKPPAPAPKKKGPVDGLKPGQFIWEQRASQAKDLRIVAVLDIQRMYVFDGSTLVAFSTMSTGKKGHSTPTGTFNILQKNIHHKSNLYNDAPMPYMQRLTWDGIALHAGHNPGYPASHGCLRLPLAFAKALYGVTKMDQVVTVMSDLNTPAPKPEVKPDPEVKPVTPDVVAQKPVEQLPGTPPPTPATPPQ